MPRLELPLERIDPGTPQGSALPACVWLSHQQLGRGVVMKRGRKQQFDVKALEVQRHRLAVDGPSLEEVPT